MKKYQSVLIINIPSVNLHLKQFKLIVKTVRATEHRLE